MRIGHGFDIHRFEIDKPLILGGVAIPFRKGMRAHSDGDVVLHAICDALLGAAALGDIGQHFPDHDPQWQQADSRFFLKHVVELLKQHKFQVQNIDATIIAEAPKLAPYIAQMCENIAADVGMMRSAVNVKATTMEKLGPIGNEEGIAVHAVVLLTTRLHDGRD
jgi:2-C-methyl-D-erythritol 2,4-cyclodiphosphate synthase